MGYDAVESGACGSTMQTKIFSFIRDNNHYSTLRKVAPGSPKVR